MYEKVNPMHPDKLADRIAGALVDMAYQNERAPKIAVEVLLGHGTCTVIAETSTPLSVDDVRTAVERIAGITDVRYIEVPQDPHLADNQNGAVRCGDNGIFKGVPLTDEQRTLSRIARAIYKRYPFDGIVQRFIEQVGGTDSVFLLRDSSQIAYDDVPKEDAA